MQMPVDRKISTFTIATTIKIIELLVWNTQSDFAMNTTFSGSTTSWWLWLRLWTVWNFRRSRIYATTDCYLFQIVVPIWLCCLTAYVFGEVLNLIRTLIELNSNKKQKNWTDNEIEKTCVASNPFERTIIEHVVANVRLNYELEHEIKKIYIKLITLMLNSKMPPNLNLPNYSLQS